MRLETPTLNGRKPRKPGGTLLGSAPPSHSPLATGDEAGTIQAVLAYFKLGAAVVKLVDGPTRATWELIPAPGTPVRKLEAIQRDIGVALARPGVVVEISDKVLLRVPHEQPHIVRLHQIPAQVSHRLPLRIGMGDDAQPVTADLHELPHLLIGGATGTGKTVLLRSMLHGLAECVGGSFTDEMGEFHPGAVNFVCIDLKHIGLAEWANTSHSPYPVASTTEAAADALKSLCDEMYLRYAAVGNGADLSSLTRYVVAIDELADMTTSDRGRVACLYLEKLLRMGRAAGFHVIAATQRPSVKAIPGDLKANIPARLALRCATKTDSRVVLDENGAESLTCAGEFIFRNGADMKRGRAAIL